MKSKNYLTHFKNHQSWLVNIKKIQSEQTMNLKKKRIGFNYLSGVFFKSNSIKHEPTW